jgi:arsenite/tail-anchored protein-transporting ATPase
MPRDGVLEALARLHGELADVRDVLGATGTSVRLVLTPEAVVVAEARRTLTSLSLFGYRVDAVVANRVFPGTATADPWLAGWVDAQRAVLAEVAESFAPLPVLQGPYCASEPVGATALGALAEQMYGDLDPVAEPPERGPMDVERSGDEFVLTVALPFADRDDMDLVRTGDELVLSVGSARRVLALPSALRRCSVVGAVLRDDVLRIRFEPDPSQWRGL